MKMCSHGDQTKSEDKKVIHPAVLLTWSLKFFCTTSDMTMFIQLLLYERHREQKTNQTQEQLVSLKYSPCWPITLPVSPTSLLFLSIQHFLYSLSLTPLSICFISKFSFLIFNIFPRINLFSPKKMITFLSIWLFLNFSPSLYTLHVNYSVLGEGYKDEYDIY